VLRKQRPQPPAAVDERPAEAHDAVGSTKLATWAADEADLGLVIDLLFEVIDPELGVNVIDLGLIYGVHVSDRVLQVRMTMTTPGCPLQGYFDDTIRTTVAGIPGIDDTALDIVWEPPWQPEMMSDLAKDQLGWRR
jgi:metal-sulfur cluster biosynthetic enzyme